MLSEEALLLEETTLSEETLLVEDSKDSTLSLEGSSEETVLSWLEGASLWLEEDDEATLDFAEEDSCDEGKLEEEIEETLPPQEARDKSALESKQSEAGFFMDAPPFCLIIGTGEEGVRSLTYVATFSPYPSWFDASPWICTAYG